MCKSLNAIARAFKVDRAPVSEVPALIRPETWADVGILTIGPKSYGHRCYPGNPAAGCTRIVRLFLGDGFADETYDVSFHTTGPALCTCPDFVYRDKEHTGETCRHIRAVVALELDRQPVPTADLELLVPDPDPLPDSDLELTEDPDSPIPFTVAAPF